jgi:hypothetical protein
MNWKPWLVIVGAAALTAAVTDCEDKKVRDYLGANGQMREWQKGLADAVCQLEEENPSGLDPAKRICPNGPGGPGDKTPPPAFPPQ